PRDRAHVQPRAGRGCPRGEADRRGRRRLRRGARALARGGRGGPRGLEERRARGLRDERRARAARACVRERGGAVTEASAVAHPNVALSKYWGKRPGAGKIPAVPSLSVTLGGVETRTHGGFAEPDALARVIELLDRVRAASGERRRAAVRSENDFPTASGLASSASGFAALAPAATPAAGPDWDAACG